MSPALSRHEWTLGYMPPEIQIAIVSAASALLGSIVGGLLSYLTARQLKIREWHQVQLEKEITKREDLYSAFVVECGSLVLVAFDQKLTQAKGVAPLTGLLSRIEMCSSGEVVSAARDFAKYAFAANESGRGPLTHEESLVCHQKRTLFAECVRKEINVLKKNA
jgi:hypothetical protein